MRFTKMHGLGNDYVYVNGFEEDIDDPQALSKRIADRHFGVGGDGLILLLPVEDGVDANCRMRMFNIDGSEGEMCGNGIRCVAKYAFDHGLTRETRVPIDTDAGLRWAECAVENGVVRPALSDVDVESRHWLKQRYEDAGLDATGRLRLVQDHRRHRGIGGIGGKEADSHGRPKTQNQCPRGQTRALSSAHPDRGRIRLCREGIRPGDRKSVV